MRGAHITVGRRGIKKTVGAPGTGVYYTSRSGHHTGVNYLSLDKGLSEQPGLLLPLILLAVALLVLLAVLLR